LINSGKVARKEERIKFVRTIEFLNKNNKIQYKKNKIIFSRNLAPHVARDKNIILNVYYL